jgi:hypothetical protein
MAGKTPDKLKLQWLSKKREKEEYTSYKAVKYEPTSSPLSSLVKRLRRKK